MHDHIMSIGGGGVGGGGVGGGGDDTVKLAPGYRYSSILSLQPKTGAHYLLRLCQTPAECQALTDLV